MPFPYPRHFIRDSHHARAPRPRRSRRDRLAANHAAPGTGTSVIEVPNGRCINYLIGKQGANVDSIQLQVRSCHATPRPSLGPKPDGPCMLRHAAALTGP